MTYARRLRNFAMITAPWVLLQGGCVLSGEELKTLTTTGIRDFVTAFFRAALGNVLGYAF